MKWWLYIANKSVGGVDSVATSPDIMIQSCANKQIFNSTITLLRDTNGVGYCYFCQLCSSL